jgi:hypothetical protein
MRTRPFSFIAGFWHSSQPGLFPFPQLLESSNKTILQTDLK